MQCVMLYIALFGGGPITLLFDWMAPEASGLGVVGGRDAGSPVPLVPKLRPVCGVDGAEVAFDDMGAG